MASKGTDRAGAARRVLSEVARLVFPVRCLVCGTAPRRSALSDAVFACARCRSALLALADRVPARPRARAAARPVVCCGTDRSVLGRLVRALKYYRRPAHARLLGWLLAERVRALRLEFDVLVAVPSEPRRRAWRAVDHAEAIARRAAAELGLPFLPGVIERSRGPRLARLGRAARAAAATASYRCGPRRVDGLRVGVVDDVVTTGTTLGVCCGLVQAQGAVATRGLCLVRRDRVDRRPPRELYSAPA